MPAPTVVFTDTVTNISLELGGDDLPNNPITWGGKLRRNVVRYAGDDHASAQILGTIDEPFTMRGTFDDHWFGRAGHAENMQRLCEELHYAGHLVHLQYNGRQRWGLFSAVVQEETPDRRLYEISFEPIFRKQPTAGLFTYRLPPGDAGALIDAQIQDMKDYTAGTGDSANVVAQFYGAVLRKLLEAEGQIGGVLTTIAQVAYWSDLSVDIARQAIQSLSAAVGAFGNIERRLRGAGGAAIATGEGLEELLAEAWRDQMLAMTHVVRKDALRLLLDLWAVFEPLGSRTHVVRSGETLRDIARQYYNDWTLWTVIADANDLDSDDVSPGDELRVPTL